MLQFTTLHQSAAVKILPLLGLSAQDCPYGCYILEDRHSRVTRQNVSVLILIFLKITFCVSLWLYVFVFLNMPSLHLYFLRTFHTFSLFLGYCHFNMSFIYYQHNVYRMLFTDIELFMLFLYVFYFFRTFHIFSLFHCLSFQHVFDTLLTLHTYTESFKSRIIYTNS